MGAPAPMSDERRHRLQRLDDCLQLFESAHEKGMVTITPVIADAVRERVPRVIAGMPIADAIEEVFRLQEPLLLPGEPEPVIDRRSRTRRPVDVRMILGSSRRDRPPIRRIWPSH